MIAYLAILLRDLEEIDREFYMQREPRMMDLRKFPHLNAEEWRFSEGNHIARGHWVNMTRELRWPIFRKAVGIENVLNQGRPAHLAAAVTP